MAKLGRYELIKIGKKNMFFLLSLFLIFGNLLTLYLYEKNKTVYHYGYEQKEVYQSYLGGNTAIDSDGFYQQEKERQTVYLETYPEFLREMRERAAEMEKLTVFSEKNSFAYRNIEKTCEDYEKLSDVTVVEDNCFGIRELAAYDGGILFLLVFLAVLFYFLLFYERNQGLLLLLKGTRKGHTELASAKVGAALFLAAAYTILQEGSSILLLGYLYGFGDMTRSIQSVSEFRNCAYSLTVAEAIGLILLTRIMIAVVFAMVVFWISTWVHNEMSAIILAGILFAVEFGFDRILSSSGVWNWLKCVNPFYCWNMKQMLGTYINLNLFGYASGKEACALVLEAVVAIAGALGGIYMFHASCQIRSESYLEKILVWLRNKTGFLWRHTSLWCFECFKVLVQQKKGIMLVLLLLFCISEATGTQQYYSTAGEATYHSYMKRLQGRVTEESIDFVYEEQAYVQELYEKLAALGSDRLGKNYLIAMQLQTEITSMEDGVQMLADQLEMLQSKEGSIYDKYWVDEKAYIEIWNDVSQEISLWLIGVIAVILWCGGIFPMDEKRKIMPLLRSAKNGRGYFERKKYLCAAAGTLLIFILSELPFWMRYYRIDGFASVHQKISDFTMLFVESSMYLGVFLILVSAVKAVSLAMTAFCVIHISKRTKSEIVTDMLCIGITGAIAVLMYSFQIDFTIWLLQCMR